MRAPVASVLLRESPHYRRDAFSIGLSRYGYKVQFHPLSNPQRGDLLVLWNRYRRDEAYALAHEAVGARVLIAENGWIGKDQHGNHFYALARSHHNGAGQWSVGTSNRWPIFGVDVRPWRRHGDAILVLAQRGIGEPGVASPQGWLEDVTSRLRKHTDRPITIRQHPGKDRTDPYAALEGCWAAVTWASGAAIKSIVAGTPVFYEMEKWIGGPAAKLGIHDIEHPFVGDRSEMLHRLSWAQWSADEIASGEPFECLFQ